MTVDSNELLDLYRCMVRIRSFEEHARKAFLKGGMPGFLHLYSGEEAIAAGVMAVLDDEDYIVTSHRGHGHLLARGGDPNRMFAELYGRVDGYCKGKGGSMHIADMAHGMLGANGIVGAAVNIGTGAAFAAKYRGRRRSPFRSSGTARPTGVLSTRPSTSPRYGSYRPSTFVRTTSTAWRTISPTT